MKTLKECKDLTNPQLLVEIKNRDALILTKGVNSELIKDEINEIWKLMQKNGYK
jgi:hypothetical protein